MKICPRCEEQFGDEHDVCPHDGMKLRRRMTAAADPMLGRVLDGRWKIEEKLGEGGMGAVYRARQTSVGRAVAIKTLKQELASSDEFANRFLREVHVATTLNHPHIVTVFDSGQADDGTLFFVMELLEGQSLTDLLKQGTLPHASVIQIGIQVASALEAAHALKFVHRDLKPDNVFMLKMAGGTLFTKVLDFGIAKMLEDDKKVTRTGMIFGTPDYMSPEQCKGSGVDHRTDFYALGCMLFEMVSGQTPFRADTPMSMLLAHVNEPAPRPSALGVPVDPKLEDFIMALLSKNAADRPETATDVRVALEQLLSTSSTTAALWPAAGRPTTREPLAFAETTITAAVLPSAHASTVSMSKAADAPGVPRPTTSGTPGNQKLIGVLIALALLIGGLAFGLYKIATKPEAATLPEAVAAAPLVAPEPPVVPETVEDVKTVPDPEVAADKPTNPEKNKKKAGKKGKSKDKDPQEERSEAEPIPTPKPERTPEPAATPEIVVTPSTTSPAPQPDTREGKIREDFENIGKDWKKASEKEKKRIKRQLERFKGPF